MLPCEWLCGGAHLGQFVFEAVRQIDAGTVFGARYRIADRFANGIEYTIDMNPATSGIDIDVVVDLREDRIEYLLKRRREYRKHRRERFGILPCHDFQDGFALRWGGALVDDRLTSAFAFVDGAGPMQQDRDLHAVELHIAVVAAVDRDRAHRSADTFGWQRVELARATV